jgi:hypothetical protein
MIDKGTSILVAHHVRSDFTAETALEALAQTFASHGLPASMTLDRDTRWVGAPQGSDFPSVIRITRNKMGLSKDIIVRSIRSAFCRLVPKPWMKSAR